MKTNIHIIIALLLILVARAQVPQQLSYQGRVTVAGQNFDGTGQFKFALVNAAGNTTFWSHDGTSIGGGAPTGSISLSVSKGLYSVPLGATNPIPPTILQNNTDVRLRVWFNDGIHGVQQLAPDQKLAASAWALVAETANGVKPGGVTLAQLAPELQGQLAGLLAWQTANKPVIVGPTTILVGEEAPFSAAVVITGATSASIVGAPAGVTYDFATQMLSGGGLTGGPFIFSLTASNPAGSTVVNVTLNVAPSIYVDILTGNEANAGTAAAPVQSIGKGIELANAATPKRSVRVSKGSYGQNGPLMLVSGVNVFGQYDKAAGWTRGTGNLTNITNTVANGGHVYAVQAVDLTVKTKLDGFQITAGNATQAGGGSYGVAARDCLDLIVSNNVIAAGNGMPGSNGGSGAIGGVGTKGQNGTDGFIFQQPPLPGIGGSPNGGNGGLGFNPVTFNAVPGSSGSGTGGGAGGAAGVAGSPGGPGGNGSSGANGSAHGTGGSGGAGGIAEAATLKITGGDGAIGNPGGSGGMGGGGGGGGGGGSAAGHGGGGGAGGEGGFGGNGGLGGKRGGASLPVFIIGGNVSVLNCSLLTGTAGKGGNGGAGVTGGNGGAGGDGGTGEVFGSGAGGIGGAGGKGASGGGGGGGVAGWAVPLSVLVPRPRRL